MKRWIDKDTFYVIFDSITEMVSYCKNTSNSSTMYSKSSHNTTMREWFGTSTYEEADDLALHGWEDGYKKLKEALPDVHVNPTAQDRKHYERIRVEGFVPCVPRAIEGHPEAMFYCEKIPFKHKVLNLIIHVGATSGYGVDDFIQRATFVARLIDELEHKGYRINLYTAKSAYCNGQYYMFMVRIKASTEQLSLKRIAYPIGHPSMQRRHFFKVLETLEVDDGWNSGYGRTDDTKIKEYIKEHHDAALFIPSLNAMNIGTDYNNYMERVFKYNDFKLT